MKLIKEPLLHFLLIGGLIFAVTAMAPSPSGEAADADPLIAVSPGRIEQLSAVFAKTWQRPPTTWELRELIDDYVLEEAYAREAIRMGLEKDDTIVRRRLRQKLEFLTADLMVPTEPSEDELADFIESNPEKFREAPRLDLRQVFFNPEKLDGEDGLQAALAALRAGGAVEGHTTLLPASCADAPLRSIAAIFGDDFAGQIAELAPGNWQGPLRSGFGLHLVLVEKRVPGRLPELDEIRDTVHREWVNERRKEMTRRFDEKLLERYGIEIQWPEGNNS